MVNQNKGINVFGFVTGEFGIAEATRLNIKALKSVGVPVAISNYDVKTRHRHADETFTDFNDDFPFGISLYQISPSEVNNLLTYKTHDKLKEKYNILYVAWESEYFPEEFKKNISYFDEIWVPSIYCKEIISKNTESPVIVIPHPIDLIAKSTIETTNFYDGTKFNFLFIFDYNSSIDRKNVIGLIDAFDLAFLGNSEVCLTIKTSLSKKYKSEKRFLQSKIKGKSNIKIVEKIYQKIELNEIISKCDCYVSLHRSEGFGLTMAEAMYYNKPVIATGYSGNLQFMNNNNSFLVPFDITVNTKNVINYKKDTVWAKPSLNKAAEFLKFVFTYKSEATAISLVGQKEIFDNLSLLKIGQLMKDRIEYIDKHIDFEPTKKEFLLKQIEIELLNKELKSIKKSLLVRLILIIKNLFRQFQIKFKIM